MDSADDVLIRLVIDNAVTVAVLRVRYSPGKRQCRASLLYWRRSHEQTFRALFRSMPSTTRATTLPLRFTAPTTAFSVCLAASARSASLVPMAVFVFAADVGFVHFNDAAELFRFLR